MPSGLREAANAALDTLIEQSSRLPGSECEIFVASLGGAMKRVPRSATPYVGRDARYIMNAHGRWSNPADDASIRAWARQVFERLAPYATGNGYVNFLTEDETDRVVASYGENYPRLQAISAASIPDNLFRVNLTIGPA